MTVATSDYGITTDINLPYERAVEVTKEALAQEWFGVRAGYRGGTSIVAAIDPVKQLGVTSNSALEPGAIEVKGRLERMLEKISS